MPSPAPAARTRRRCAAPRAPGPACRTGGNTESRNPCGVRYRRGGTSGENGFDCSGFTRYVFGNSLGLALPRSVDEQATAPGLVRVQREDLQPGDLVFFNTLKRTLSHVDVHIGDNRFIHAPRPGG